MQGKVKAGVSTFSLGGVSVTAYVLAVLAFLDGQHDTTTIGLVATGTVALVTMAAGRFWQAVEKIRQPAPTVSKDLDAQAVELVTEFPELAIPSTATRLVGKGGVVESAAKGLKRSDLASDPRFWRLAHEVDRAVRSHATWERVKSTGLSHGQGAAVLDFGESKGDPPTTAAGRAAFEKFGPDPEVRTGTVFTGSTATAPRPSAGVTLADEPREGDTTGCQPQDDH